MQCNEYHYEGQINTKLQFNGEGCIQYTNEKCKYQGQFENGHMHGKGKYTFANGSHFNGLWRNQQLIQVFSAYMGSTYILVEQYSKEKCVGQRKCENQTFIGEMSATGIPNGQGHCIFANGDTYAGSFADGLLNG